MSTKQDFHVYGLWVQVLVRQAHYKSATYRISSIPPLAGLTMTFETILNRFVVSARGATPAGGQGSAYGRSEANLNRNLLKLNLRDVIIL